MAFNGAATSLVPWTDATLATNFAHALPVQYMRTADNEVVVRGAVTWSAATPAFTTMFTLPAGFVPATNAMFPCSVYIAGVTASLYVRSTGAVQIWASAATGNVWLPLTGIRFSLT